MGFTREQQQAVFAHLDIIYIGRRIGNHVKNDKDLTLTRAMKRGEN